MKANDSTQVNHFGGCNHPELMDDEPLYKKIVRVKALHQHLAERASPISVHLVHEASTLFRLTKQIRNAVDLETLLQTTVDEVKTLLHNECCYFLWCMSSGDRTSLIVTHEAKSQACPSRLGDLPTEHSQDLVTAIAQLQLIRIDDIDLPAETTPETHQYFEQLGIKAALLLPLKTHSGQTGALMCTQSCGLRIWSDTEVELLQALADQVAISIDQAELLARARATALAAQSQAQQVSDALQKLQQTQAQLVQQEKMSSLGQLVAGVAHEINNPINFIDGNIKHATHYIHDLLALLELYQSSYPNPEDRIQEFAEEIDLPFLIEDLTKILASMELGTSRIKQIVLSLRNFSRLDEAEIKPVNLHDGIDNTLIILRSRLKGVGQRAAIAIDRQYGSLPQVECHAGQLNQVFMNILSNAIDALDSQQNPKITIQTAFFEQAPQFPSSPIHPIECPYVEVCIRDNGPGMEPDIQQKVFDPFYTTKPVGKGTGLGLSISYQIVVEKHHGNLICHSKVGKGTEFIVQIPVQLIE